MKNEIDKLCLKYNLSEKVKKEITSLCSKSYISGSNDCDKLTKEYYYLTPKSVK